jgi:hypothetical protein
MSANTSRPYSSTTKPLARPPFDKLYWLRIGLGVFAGLLAEVITGSDFLNGVSLAILVYLVSYYLARFGWYRTLDRQFQGKIYTTGLGVYAGMFLFTWILLFTLASA